MNTKKINVVIKNNDEISEFSYDAIVNNWKIEYIENNLKTSLFIKDIVKLKREDDDMLLEIDFIPNEKSKGSYKSKKENINIELEIITDYVIILENVIIIKYKVLTTQQNVIFKLEM